MILVSRMGDGEFFVVPAGLNNSQTLFVFQIAVLIEYARHRQHGALDPLVPKRSHNQMENAFTFVAVLLPIDPAEEPKLAPGFIGVHAQRKRSITIVEILRLCDCPRQCDERLLTTSDITFG